MTILDITAIGFVMVILAFGCFLVRLFRREPRKALNAAVLAIGFSLLVYVHLQWAGRHESPQVKEAMFIRPLIAGWAMFGMGFLGVQCGHKDSSSC